MLTVSACSCGTLPRRRTKDFTKAHKGGKSVIDPFVCLCDVLRAPLWYKQDLEKFVTNRTTKDYLNGKN